MIPSSVARSLPGLSSMLMNSNSTLPPYSRLTSSTMGFIALQYGQVPERKYITLGLLPPEQAASESTSVTISHEKSKRRFLFIGPSGVIHESAGPRRRAATATKTIAASRPRTASTMAR